MTGEPATTGDVTLTVVRAAGDTDRFDLVPLRPFRDAEARRDAAGSWTFSIAGKGVPLLPPGHDGDLSRPQSPQVSWPDGAPGSLTFAAPDESPALQGGETEVQVYFYGGGGARLARSRLLVGDLPASVTPPDGAAAAVISLRLRGLGRLGGLLVEEGVGTDRSAPFADAPADLSAGKALEAAQAALAEGRPDRARDLLGDHQDNARVQRTLLLTLSRLRLYDEVIALFETAQARVRLEPSAVIRYIEACANTGRIAEARAAFQSVASAPGDDVAAKLLPAYKFSSVLPPFSRRLLRHRLIDVAGSGTFSDLRPLLRCLHDAVMDGDAAPVADLLNRRRRREWSRADQIRIALLLGQAAFVDGDADGQTAQLNRALALSGVDPVERIDPAAPLQVVNVTGAAAEPVADGPLVTVIVTSFNSAATLGATLASLAAQTWRNLEILVVDDASGDASPDIAAGWAARDPRFQAFRMGRNGGPYVAKNHMMARAAGRWITSQDSDDWAHPRKIEGLVRHLLDRSLAGAMVQHVRLSAASGFQCRTDYARPDFSSLMFPREETLAAIGYYDCIRAGADSEFRARMVRRFGAQAVSASGQILSLVTADASSLSGGGAFAIDEDSGVLGPVRTAYRRAYAAWHAGRDRPHVPFPPRRRPFDCPAGLEAAVEMENAYAAVGAGDEGRRE